jgi:hypothetical protein
VTEVLAECAGCGLVTAYLVEESGVPRWRCGECRHYISVEFEEGDE